MLSFDRIMTCSPRTAIWKIIAIYIIFVISTIGAQSTLRLICENGTTDPTECNITSIADLLNTANFDINPCDDFYAHVCDKWIQAHPIPPGKTKITKFDVWQDVVLQQVKGLMGAVSHSKYSESITKARAIYGMCTNESELDKAGLSKLYEILETINPAGWPITLERQQWDRYSNMMTWQRTSRHVDSYSIPNGIYSLSLEHNKREIISRIITLSKPTLMLPERTLANPENNTEVIENYRQFIKNVAITLAKKFSWHNSSDFLESVDRDASDIMNFAIELGKILYSEFYDLPISHTIQSFQNAYGNNTSNKYQTEQINWFSVVDNMYTSEEFRLSEYDDIIVKHPGYFANLRALLAKTSSRVLVNYVQWNFIRQVLQYTTTELRNFEASVVDDAKKPRDLRCLEIPNLRHAIYHEYMKKFFPKSARDAVEQYVKDLKTKFISLLSKVDWLHEEKGYVINKLNSIRVQIGGPNWYNDFAVDVHYEELAVTTNLLETVLNINVFEQRKEAKLIRMPYSIMNNVNEEWTIPPTQVTARFNCSLNTATLPAGLLHFLYDEKRSNVINHAYLGAVIAPLLGHVYDTRCKTFKNGQYHKWSAKARLGYSAKEECYVKRILKYSIPEGKPLNLRVYINPSHSTDTYISDSGLLAAHEQYKFQLSHYEQFVASASIFCENIYVDVPKGYLFPIYDGPTGRTRVHSGFSDIEDFAKVFNCSANTPMNPFERCNLLI